MNKPTYPSSYSFIFRFFLLLVLVANLVIAPQDTAHAYNSILYVSPSGSTSGSCESWGNTCDLQYALSIAVSTDEIWIQQGTYKPTTSLDRTVSFVLKDGIALYGGFAGSENLRNERSTLPQVTILSGDIGVISDNSDNSYHVLVTSNTGNTTILDGLTIMGGNANGIPPFNFGAGIYNEAGYLQINNVVIDSNSILPAELEISGAGAGMYNSNGNPTFTNVVFKNNSIILPNNNFNSCLGGGLYNENVNIQMSNVFFIGNQVSTPMWGVCGGAGMYNKNSNVTIINAVFTDNTGNHMGWPNATLGSAGGGIWNVSSNVNIQHTIFESNKAHFGGAILNSSNVLSLQDVIIKNNTAYYYGGGIRNGGDGSTVSIINTTFIGNSAGLIGGGFINMYSAQNTITLSKVTFTENHADAGGGFAVISDTSSNITFSNLTLFNNTADYLGGGGYFGQANATINHATFNSNTDTSGGAALYNNGASPLIQNSIFWGNSSEIYNDSTSGLEVSRPTIIDSIISTGCPTGAICTNIITSNPKLGRFADNGGFTQTMALDNGSSAIDAGGKNSICATIDQRDVLRPQGNNCDIGAYEKLNINLVNSVLPTSRSVLSGNLATIFHTLINAGNTTAQNVSLSMGNQPPGTFQYQQTDCSSNSVIGSINPIVDIPPGGMVCYVLLFIPLSPFDATNVQIRAEVASVSVTPIYEGVNTWLLRSTSVLGPDIISQTTTADLHQISCSGTSAFAVALSNVGAAAIGDVTISANTGLASLPISISIQETNPGTGSIIGDHILNNLGADENRTVAIFVTFHGCVPFDPATNRIFIEFRDETNNILGSTSTAVSTNR